MLTGYCGYKLNLQEIFTLVIKPVLEGRGFRPNFLVKFALQTLQLFSNPLPSGFVCTVAVSTAEWQFHHLAVVRFNLAHHW